MFDDKYIFLVQFISKRIKYDYSETDSELIRILLHLEDRNIFHVIVGESGISVKISKADTGGIMPLIFASSDTSVDKFISECLNFISDFSREDEYLGMDKFFDRRFRELEDPKGDRIISCSEDHFLKCLECQEAEEFFSRKTWKDLLYVEKLPIHFADISLLNQSGVNYYALSYLLISIRNDDIDLLLYVSEVMKKSDCKFLSDIEELMVLINILIDFKNSIF